MIKKFLVIPLLFVSLIMAQEEKNKEFHFEFETDSIEVRVGESKEITIKLLDEKGKLVQSPFYVFGQRKTLSVSPRISDSTGVATVTVTAHKPGRLSLSTQTITVKRDDRIRASLIVNVPFPPLDRIVFNQQPSKLYQGTATLLSVEVFDKANLNRSELTVKLKSSNTDVAQFDMFGNLETKRTGKIKVSATAEDVTASFSVRVVKNPIRKVTLSLDKEEIRTGDVISLKAKALNRSGRTIDDAPIIYTYIGQSDYGKFGLPAAGLVTDDGRFVAETAGMYTLIASSGGYSAQKTIKVIPREVRKKAKLVGHGLITDVLTSDLWVWAGIDKHEGKDFAVTGTWGSNGEAYFWDVTNPDSMIIIDTIKVDARTVNDVKISEDGRVGVMTREGASNRKNGFVVLDVSDPYNVIITAEFNDDMTGGVHNVFIYDNHIYAVNNGRKYDIINIDDPSNPFRVGVYEMDTPGHSIHDVWIENGIAYSSNWSDGVIAVDVGGMKFDEADRSESQFNPLLAKAGKGSPSNPVKLAEMGDPNGLNHAAFPFLSKSTGNFYIVGGDETFPWGVKATSGEPSNPRGGFHFLNFTNPDEPREDAVYQVPEAGSHNMWVYDDVLMAAFYQGGLRVVDISGELLGDIYNQGREIAVYQSAHKEGKIPNATMVWGAQPYKDYIFLTDMNSGLYCIQLEDIEKAPGTP
ncbi:MAG: LVIVD repeat-containing protein [Fidelibacterota bacterium]